MNKHESLLNEAHSLLKEVYKFLDQPIYKQTEESRGKLRSKVYSQLGAIGQLFRPKLEIAVGRWYENDVGIILLCDRFDSNYIFDKWGNFLSIKNLVREVKVSPVENEQ